jgi:hypothetical protein
MVKYDEISKIRCEQIILLVLPLLCGYKEFSCNNQNLISTACEQHEAGGGRNLPRTCGVGN